jgi:transcriptional regulator with XRE-family HTH domain
MAQSKRLKEIVCRNIKAKRLEVGMSQQKLSLATRLTVHYLSKLERQPQNLTLDTIEDIADALDVPVAELILGEEPKLPKPSKGMLDAIDHVIRLLQAYKAKS